MSEIPLFLVSHLKTNRTLNDMAKVQIKSEKTTLFKRIFSIIEQFDALSTPIENILNRKASKYESGFDSQ